MRFWRRPEDELEAQLRAARAEPRPDFVHELGRSIGRATRARHRGSRLAFAGALTVFMVGSFASIGGLSYAAAGASEAITVAKRVAAENQIQLRDRSAATDQYAPDVAPVFQPPVAAEAIQPPVAAEAIPPAELDVLPVTGISLAATAAVGFGLILLGVALRRRERRS